MFEIVHSAYEIAKRDLKSCYGSQGIFAGSTHFKNYWARDSFYASLGAIQLKDYEIVKKNLLLFLEKSKKISSDKLLVPLRIGDKNIFLSFLGFHSNKLTARYTQDKGNNPAGDSNSLFIISYVKYVQATKDLDFYKKTHSQFKKIISYNLSLINNEQNLVYTGKYATWQDSIKKEGYTLHNNIFLYYSLKLASQIITEPEFRSKLKKITKQLKIDINNKFWNGKYYNDWNKNSYFVPYENNLCILFDLANTTQSHSIIRYVMESDINNSVPSLTNYQIYPKKQISPELSFFGMGDYHNHSVSWLFIGLVDVLARHKIGLHKESLSLLENISKTIVKFDAVFECYYKNRPLKRLFYKSEKHFAWSSSFFIIVYERLKKWLK